MSSGNGATPGKAILRPWILWTTLFIAFLLALWQIKKHGTAPTLEEKIKSRIQTERVWISTTHAKSLKDA